MIISGYFIRIHVRDWRKNSKRKKHKSICEDYSYKCWKSLKPLAWSLFSPRFLFLGNIPVTQATTYPLVIPNFTSLVQNFHELQVHTLKICLQHNKIMIIWKSERIKDCIWLKYWINEKSITPQCYLKKQKTEKHTHLFLWKLLF